MRYLLISLFYTFFLLHLMGCGGFQRTSTTNVQAAENNMQLGLAYLKAGEIASAKMKLLQAVEQAPHIAAIQSAMAYFFEQVGESQKAEQYHSKALTLNKRSGTIHNNYGCFLYQKGRYQEAENQFLYAIEDTHYLKTACAYENAGLCAFKRMDFKKSIYYFQQALKHDQTLTKSLLTLADISFQEQKYIQANRYMQKYKKYKRHAQPDNAFAVWLETQIVHKLDDRK